MLLHATVPGTRAFNRHSIFFRSSVSRSSKANCASSVCYPKPSQTCWCPQTSATSPLSLSRSTSTSTMCLCFSRWQPRIPRRWRRDTASATGSFEPYFLESKVHNAIYVGSFEYFEMCSIKVLPCLLWKLLLWLILSPLFRRIVLGDSSYCHVV